MPSLRMWSTIGILSFFALYAVTTAETTYDRERLEAMLATRCSQQCRGEINNPQLAKICMCDGNRKTFIYGKRADEKVVSEKALPEQQKVVGEFESEDEVQEVNEKQLDEFPSEKEIFKRPVRKEDLLELLNKKYTEKKSPELEKTDAPPPSYTDAPPPNYISLDASSDIGRALNQLLQYQQKLHSQGSTLEQLLQNREEQQRESKLQKQQRSVDFVRDFFKEDMGVDIESATKDDFLKWVEKEMKIAEQRLMKLMMFYDYIGSTPDLD